VGKKLKKKKKKLPWGVVCFFWCFFLQLCGVAGGALNHPYADSPKFGYKLNMKVNCQKTIILYFWLPT
jgi:hypothetical protein